MIKKTLALFLLSFSSLSIFAQGKVEGGFYAEYFQLGDRGFNDFGGMLHVPIGDKVTLNYHIGFGTSTNGGIFVHSTGGAAAGFWILNELGGTGLRVGYLSFLLCMVPEGVGFYLPEKNKISTHVSINPLSVEYYYKMSPYEEWGKLGCDVVLRFKMYNKKKIPDFIAPQISGTWIYTPGESTARFGVKAGVTIGFEKRE